MAPALAGARGPGAGSLEVVDRVSVGGGASGPGAGRLEGVDSIGFGGVLATLERAGLMSSIASAEAQAQAAGEWATSGLSTVPALAEARVALEWAGLMLS